MKPLAILHTESSCGWGGQELRILDEAAGLIERGHRVELVGPAQARILAEAPRFGVAAYGLPIERKGVRGLGAMRCWLRRRYYDVVNTHSSTDSWLTALACASLGLRTPLVRTRHISAPIADNAATRWLYTRATTKIVTTGEALRQCLIAANRYPPQRVISVPTGIETTRFCPGDQMSARAELGLETGVRIIGIVATLRSWKGHHHLIEACSQLADHDWRLVILGDGPRREYLEKMILRLGLGERIRMLGYRRDPERWLRALDVFCLPSYANEGVPQALIQAMLSAVPIVTTPVGGITEAVTDGEHALVVAAARPDVLAAAIRRILADPALALRLGAAARVRALSRFGREHMLSNMERVFAEVSSGGPCAARSFAMERRVRERWNR